MQWPFQKSVSENLVLLALGRDSCRFLAFQGHSPVQLLHIHQVAFADLDELGRHLGQWLKQLSISDARCRWLLSRERYQSLLIEKPEVAENEIDQAAKWLVRDQLDFPPDEVLMQHYQPIGSHSRSDQVVLVACQKGMIEKLVEISHKLDLELEHIAIEELCIGLALQQHLESEQICGFIGEDQNGLIFNFYQGQSLTFNRYIRGKNFPKVEAQELSLDTDIEEANEQFLLEIQRTLDYAVNQIYRAPVMRLLLQPCAQNENLANLIKQLTEIPVVEASASVVDTRAEDPANLQPGLAELGLALRGAN